MVDLSRRKTIIGMGLLAAGSGAAFSSAAFQNSVNPGADFRIIAASDLRVRPGPAFQEPLEEYVVEDFDTLNGIDFNGINPSDLPLAWASDGQTNDDLAVELARLNNASEVVFEGLIEIVNEGDSMESVGISYQGGYDTDNVDTSGDGNAPNGNGQMYLKDVQEMFQFLAQGGGGLAFGSDTLISPDPAGIPDTGGDLDTEDNNAPANFIHLNPGQAVSVDLKTDLTGDQVSIVQAATTLGGNPFDGDIDGFGVLDDITVGTEQ
jgi:hypothetical protein